MPLERAPARDQHQPVHCPTCRLEVDDHETDASVLCSSCLALHHKQCWMGVCAGCGRKPDAAQTTPAKKKKKSKARASSWSKVKLAAHGVWLVSYVVALVAMTAALAVGTPLRFRLGDWPLWVSLLMLPNMVLTLPLVILDLVDAILRRLHRPSASWLPLVFAAVGFCTGGLSSFVYYVVWGRKPLEDGADTD